MKLLRRNLMLLFMGLSFTAYSQNWQWDFVAGGIDGFESARSICYDANGFIYATAQYTSDPSYFGNDTLHGVYQRMVLAKFSPEGVLLWLKPYNGHDLDGDVRYNPTNNSLYVAGNFQYGMNLGCNVLSSGGQNDFYLARLDTDGNCMWSVKYGGTYDDRMHSYAITDLGEVVINFTLKSSILINNIWYGSGSYLAKFDSIGTMLWIKKKFDTSTSSLGAKAVFFDLKIQGNAMFGLGMAAADSLDVDDVHYVAQFPIDQYFIARLNGDGDMIWMKPCAGRTLFTEYGSIVVGNDLSSYVAGLFQGEAIFDVDTLHSPSSMVSEMFLAKYDPNGNAIWAVDGNTTEGCSANGLVFNESNELYVGGGFLGSMSLGNYSATAGRALFVARLDTAGNTLAFTSVENGGIANIAADQNGNFCIAGAFINTIQFDALTPHTSYGSADILIAQSGTLTGIQAIGTAPYEALHIYANPNNGICTVDLPSTINAGNTLVLTIFDAQGRVVEQAPLVVANGLIQLDIQAQAKGVYMVELLDGEHRYNGTIVFE